MHHGRVLHVARVVCYYSCINFSQGFIFFNFIVNFYRPSILTLLQGVLQSQETTILGKVRLSVDLSVFLVSCIQLRQLMIGLLKVITFRRVECFPVQITHFLSLIQESLHTSMDTKQQPSLLSCQSNFKEFL